MILIGELSLWVALLMAAWSMTVSYAGGALRRDDLVASGVRGLYATFAMIVLASAGLWTALLTRDFSLEYVASHISSTMPTVYVFTAFWSGQAGSMLFWALILSMYGTIAIATSRKRNAELIPWATGTLSAILVFFIATTCLKANPFTRLDFLPLDGRGMNPQLQNPGMALHPPNLYLGYVATAIPFAFGIAALFARKLDAEWLGVVRRWALLSWFFLTIGIVLGMWWAYVELGWSGYWAWDPVENSSFLPWLTTTAFLHSIMIQEKRGMLRKWNVVLVVVSFLLSIFGTFITRSGVIESVHSFAQSPVGPWFATFFFLATGITIYLVGTRLRDLEAKAGLESMVSREAAFLYNNLLLCGIAFAVLWGTVFPILSEWAKGTKITVGPPFFNSVNVPLGLLLLALTGIGPLIAWRRASVSNLKRQFLAPVIVGIVVAAGLVALGMRSLAPLMTYALCGFVTGTIVQEFYKGIRARQSIHSESVVPAFMHLVGRNRRRYGGYIVHAGIVMLFAAFAGMAFKADHEVALRAGESYQVRDPYGHQWKFVSQGTSWFNRVDRNVVGVALEAFRDGKRVGIIASEKRTYLDAQGKELFQPVTEVGIRSTAKLDTYLVVSGFTGSNTADLTAELRISFNPLVVWVWIGGFLMMIGGLVVMWPQAERRLAPAGYAAVMRPAESTPDLAGAVWVSSSDFLQRAAGGSAALVLASSAGAQQRGAIHDSMVVRDSTNLFAMDQAAALPVRLPPKAGAVPLLTADQRDDLEHRIHCQCGCTLDIYTCRTTDFSCQVSPAMHRDVVALVEGGYSAQEIIDAFVGVYGERARMAPKKSGFNLLVWFGPATAVLIGAGILFVLLRRWGAATPARQPANGPALDVDATPDELARLDAAVKGEDRG